MVYILVLQLYQRTPPFCIYETNKSYHRKTCFKPCTNSDCSSKPAHLNTHNSYSANHDCSRQHSEIFLFVFLRKYHLMFQVNPLLGRGFTWKIKPYFLQKINIKKNKMSSAAILVWRFGALRVNDRISVSRCQHSKPGRGMLPLYLHVNQKSGNDMTDE